MDFCRQKQWEKYVDAFINQQKKIKVTVNFNGVNLEKQFDIKSFLKYNFLFKGIFGKSYDHTFEDNLSGKIFCIKRFDKYGFDSYTPQRSLIKNEELYVLVDPIQYNDTSYGTIENPILVFSYQGVHENFTMEENTDEIGSDGRYIYKTVTGISYYIIFLNRFLNSSLDIT